MTRLVECSPPNVVFTGGVGYEDMPGYYAMSDIFFFPSLQDTFACAIIEASASGLPLVLRDNPEYPGCFLGHYLKASCEDEFVETIRMLEKKGNLFKEYQLRSEMLASRYELGNYIDQLVDYYKWIAQE
jgi:1,2-diacylglycerol-3-alpha-glucose alpha-1,2-galactosyltransferase